MIRRLFGGGSGSEVQRLLTECKVDKSHDMMSTKAITDYAQQYLLPPYSRPAPYHINISLSHNVNNNININIQHPDSQRSHPALKKQQIIQAILKKIQHKSTVMRVKGLVVAHAIVRKTFNQQFMEVMAEEMDKYIVPGLSREEKESGESLMVRLDNTQQEWMRRNIVSFYCQYLKKLMLCFETYRFAQEWNKKGGKISKEDDLVTIINHGFTILNLVNYILQSQYTFNKMGRYYIEYNQVLNLFVMYLKDLTVYNQFIKDLSKASLKQASNATTQEIKHHFLFVTEAQKSSDRLYEFFYNRYYYSKLKKVFSMPTFMTLPSQQYEQMTKIVKKNNRQLVHLVKESKYEGGRSRSRARTTATQVQDRSEDFSSESLMPVMMGAGEEKLISRSMKVGTKPRAKSCYKA